MTVSTARRIVLEGIVQGVGFRPFVFTLAARHGLCGWVRNTASGVEMEIEGTNENVQAFVSELGTQAPPLARIEKLCSERLTPQGFRDFTIGESRNGEGFQAVSPDVATCPECLSEVDDPSDRRYRYAFTNCTNCGPRFTIIRAVPYDRPNTTMAAFRMCPRCRAEYDDPRNRRFHAQPNACPECGPHLALVNPAGSIISGDPIEETCRMLDEGRIVAIKGLGGFHLACDATSETAVTRLRNRKGREAKPLALMVRDIAAAGEICVLTETEKSLIASNARPILIARRRANAAVAASVAPGLGWLGVMIPYTPVHHLLFTRRRNALVMTSGNRSEEPIATDNDDALARLGKIADAFLVHNRPIHVRCDDSVVKIVDGAEMPIRRSRGYAPLPVELPFEAHPVLACGAHLKNTVCVTRGKRAFMSPHVGDLENYETFESFRAMVERMETLFRMKPEAVAHDLHPDYLSTQHALALSTDVPAIAVQHHHAHVAACMAEHQLDGRVIGVAFDGTGYGTDGTVWGGEFLLADYRGFVRAAHLGYVPMAGGERAIREPFRLALAHLRYAGAGWDSDLSPVGNATPEELRTIEWQIDRGVNAPLTSSVGRLFDAVASLIALRHRAAYEGQAAMELEAIADDSTAVCAYPLQLRGGKPIVLDPAPIIRGIVTDVRAGTPATTISARFHETMAQAILLVCRQIREMSGLNRVVMSGGVFQNSILLRMSRRLLAESGFEVFNHHKVPPNDGGIALGQAVVAHARMTSVAPEYREDENFYGGAFAGKNGDFYVPRGAGKSS